MEPSEKIYSQNKIYVFVDLLLMLPFTLLLFNELCCASLLFVMLSQKVIKKTNPTKKKSHTRSQALEGFIYK